MGMLNIFEILTELIKACFYLSHEKKMQCMILKKKNWHDSIEASSAFKIQHPCFQLFVIDDSGLDLVSQEVYLCTFEITAWALQVYLF